MKDVIWRWWRQLWHTHEPLMPEAVMIDKLPLMERCRAYYQLLPLDAFDKYRQKDGHITPITMLYPNIDVCIQEILAHTATIEVAGYVLESRCMYQPRKITLARFLVTSDGFYLPSIKDKLKELADVVVALCDTIDEAKKVTDETNSYNLRMLSALFHSLINLAIALETIHNDIASR